MPRALAWSYWWLIITTPPLIPSLMSRCCSISVRWSNSRFIILTAAYQDKPGEVNYGRDQDHNVGGTRLWNSGTHPSIKGHPLTYRNFVNLWGLLCRSGWTFFVHGCNLSRRCLILLMNYSRCFWVVRVALEFVQRSPSCHQRQIFLDLLMLIWRECWRLVRMVSMFFMGVDGFALLSNFCQVIGMG